MGVIRVGDVNIPWSICFFMLLLFDSQWKLGDLICMDLVKLTIDGVQKRTTVSRSICSINRDLHSNVLVLRGVRNNEIGKLRNC